MITDYNLSSIDWKRSVELANDNVDLAKDLLQMFVTDLDEVRNTILTAFKEQDLSTLKHHAHRLYGASCYCGVTKLNDLLGKLENKLRESPDILHNEVKILLQEFSNEVNNILDEYQKIKI